MHENIEIQPDRQIGWEKWHDPFGHDAEDTEWPGAFGNFSTDKIIKSAANTLGHLELDEDEFHEEFDEMDIDEAIQEHHRQNLQPKKINMVMTPMGLIPMTEHTRAGKLFNFWTAHTNFSITEEIKDIIDNTDGVETLDIFTRYRWRISIGKAFNSWEVKEALMKALHAKPLKKKKKKAQVDDDDNPENP